MKKALEGSSKIHICRVKNTDFKVWKQRSNMTKDLFKEDRCGCGLQNVFSMKSLQSGVK